MASATTPAAGTTQVSLRSTEAFWGCFVARSTERSATSRVGMGLTTAKARTSSPFVTPPSSPPARLVGRSRPRPSFQRISSWKSEPRASPPAKPSPTATALTAWIDMRAWAIRPSSLRSHWANEPTPAGTPRATTSTVPPTVSPSLFARSISATIAPAAAGSTQRTGLSSTPSRASQATGAAGIAAPPMRTTWLRTSMPSSRRNDRARAPAATREVVSRALARSSTLRRSLVPYLRAPARSACPGRG